MMEHLAVIESQSFVPSRVYSDVTYIDDHLIGQPTFPNY